VHVSVYHSLAHAFEALQVSNRLDGGACCVVYLSEPSLALQQQQALSFAKSALSQDRLIRRRFLHVLHPFLQLSRQLVQEARFDAICRREKRLIVTGHPRVCRLDARSPTLALGEVGWALPEYGAIGGSYFDIPELAVGIPALQSDVSALTELILDIEEQVAVELDTDV
jgi:hypothetical protein